MSVKIGGTGISSAFEDPYSGAEAEERLHRWRRFWEHVAPRHSDDSFPVDLAEDEDNLYLEADLPGYFREDVDIQVDSDLLTIRAERKRPQTKARRRHLSERLFAAASRSFNLGPTIDADRIEASMSNGVLTIVLPKREDMKSRLIEIRS